MRPRPRGDASFVLPVGTITLLFGDVEGSVRAWEADPDAMGASVLRLNQLVDQAVGRNGGVRQVEQGGDDRFVAAFDRASDAVACALALQRSRAIELKTRLALQGLANPEIAKRLFVSRSTVKLHLSHVYAKLGMSSRTELAAEAARPGIG